MSAHYIWHLGANEASRPILVLSAFAVDATLFFFTLFCISRAVGKGVRLCAFVLVFTMSAFTVASFMVSQQWENDNQASQQHTAYTRYLSETPPPSNASLGAQAAYRNRMEQALKEQSKITSTPQTAIYSYAANALGVTKETFVLLYRILWSLAILLGSIGLKSFRSEFFTKKEITKHIQSFQELKALQVGLNRPTPVDLSTELSTGNERKKTEVENVTVVAKGGTSAKEKKPRMVGREDGTNPLN
jgi:hypothetical protein